MTEDKLGTFVLALALTLLAAMAAASNARADPPPCNAPGCVELAADEPAPRSGFFYSAAAHNQVGRLAETVLHIDAQLHMCTVRTEEAERHREEAERHREESDKARNGAERALTASQAAVRRCAGAERAAGSATPVEGTGQSRDGLPTWERVVWVGLTAAAAALPSIACDYIADRADSRCPTWARYTAGGAGAVSVLTVALVW